MIVYKIKLFLKCSNPFLPSLSSSVSCECVAFVASATSWQISRATCCTSTRRRGSSPASASPNRTIWCNRQRPSSEWWVTSEQNHHRGPATEMCYVTFDLNNCEWCLMNDLESKLFYLCLNQEHWMLTFCSSSWFVQAEEEARRNRLMRDMAQLRLQVNTSSVFAHLWVSRNPTSIHLT